MAGTESMRVHLFQLKRPGPFTSHIIKNQIKQVSANKRVGHPPSLQAALVLYDLISREWMLNAIRFTKGRKFDKKIMLILL